MIEDIGFLKYFSIDCVSSVCAYLEKASPSSTCFQNILKFINIFHLSYY
jgi:hypothetical protein